MQTQENIRESLKSAVITVGEGGRGFIVQGDRDYIITAAHCLPEQPPPHSDSYLEERTYKLLARLGEQQDVFAECLFADHVADIAVLGLPDDQGFPEGWAAYNAFTNSVSGLSISDAPDDGRAWLFSLTGELIPCRVQPTASGALWISDTAPGRYAGMSGSPIVAADGTAIGVFCTSDMATGDGGPNPRLTYHLPGWLLRELQDNRLAPT
jgi:hypothetical protein